MKSHYSGRPSGPELVQCCLLRRGKGEEQYLSRVRQLTLEGQRSGEGYFSPDGKNIIFKANGRRGIHLSDLHHEPGIRRCDACFTWDRQDHGAFFRPGSDEILFASTHVDPEAVKKQEAELDFRASGKTRRYSWDYDERMDIFSAAPSGGKLKRLTNALGYDAEGAYSPDGSKLFFAPSAMRTVGRISRTRRR